MFTNPRPEISRFVVGYYSINSPGVRHDWKPAHRDEYECDLVRANERLIELCRRMDAGEAVAGLIVSSVFVADADTGEPLLVRFVDGTQALGDVVETDALAAAYAALLAMTAACHGTPEIARALSAMARQSSSAN